MPQVKQLVTKNEFNRFPNAAALDVPVASFLGGGSFSSHVTEKWRKGASARHFPSLWHSHSWLCASLRTWRPPRLRPSRRKPHPSFTVPDGFAGRIGRLAQRDRFLSAVYAEKSLFGHCRSTYDVKPNRGDPSACPDCNGFEGRGNELGSVSRRLFRSPGG